MLVRAREFSGVVTASGQAMSVFDPNLDMVFGNMLYESYEMAEEGRLTEAQVVRNEAATWVVNNQVRLGPEAGRHYTELGRLDKYLAAFKSQFATNPSMAAEYAVTRDQRIANVNAIDPEAYKAARLAELWKNPLAAPGKVAKKAVSDLKAMSPCVAAILEGRGRSWLSCVKANPVPWVVGGAVVTMLFGFTVLRPVAKLVRG